MTMTYRSKTMTEETKEATTIVDRIKRLLYNFDLAIVYAKGEIKLREANIHLYANDGRRYSQRRFINAKVDKERFEIYIAELENAKREILDNLEIILSKYTERYKRVFIMYFIENKSYDEICEETNYGYDAVNKIASKMKKDLIQMYYIK